MLNRCNKCGRIVGILGHSCPTFSVLKGTKNNNPHCENCGLFLGKDGHKCLEKVWNKGISRTPEEKLKMSENRKGKSAGKDHPMWKGGVGRPDSPRNKRKKIMYSYEYKLWRRECLLRDFFACRKCEVSGGRLEVHHINNFAEFPELRFEIENGITLCRIDHKKFHKIYGQKNNTVEQITEFIKNGNKI